MYQQLINGSGIPKMEDWCDTQFHVWVREAEIGWIGGDSETYVATLALGQRPLVMTISAAQPEIRLGATRAYFVWQLHEVQTHYSSFEANGRMLIPNLLMNNAEEPDDQPAHVDKGKRRAQEPSELTPLLGSTSVIVDEAIVSPNSRRNLRATLTTVFLVSLSICIVIFTIIALLAWSYASRASDLTPEGLLSHDLVIAGPDRVDVLNVTKEGVWLNVRVRVGMDAGRAIGINTDPRDGPFRDIWKAIGRWSVRTLDRVSVNMSTITITPEYDPSVALVSINVSPIELPLSVDPPSDLSWLTTVSIPVNLRLTSNSTEVQQFLKESWRTGNIAVHADVAHANVRGGGLNSTSWRTNFHAKVSSIHTAIHMKSKSKPFSFCFGLTYCSTTNTGSSPSWKTPSTSVTV